MPWELRTILVTPRDHPLNRRRSIRPRDLLPFPLVNAPGSLPDRTTNGVLEESGVFSSRPRTVEAVYTAVIRRYVSYGFGIGLVAGQPGAAPHSELHERALGAPFGRPTVSLIWRKGDALPEFGHALIELIRKFIKPRRSGPRS